MLLWAVPALAYETDQLTLRHVPLRDADPVADRLVDDALSRAAAAVNARTRCEAPADVARDLLVAEFAADVGTLERVPGRGLSRSLGYGRIGAALERGPIDRLTFDGIGGSVFSEVTLLDSPVVHTAGLCSTLSLSGIRVGTDKVDHFLMTGFDVWERRRDKGRDPLRAASVTERTALGWWTSDAYSYADLAADLAGVAFYDQLLAGRYADVGGDGCLARRDHFRWADWVERSWDEVENPSVYRPAVQAALDEWLSANERAVCGSYRQWADPGFEGRIERTLAEPRPRFGVPRADPYRLAERCGPPTAL